MCLWGRSMRAQSLGRVRLFVTHGLWLARLLSPWDFPGKNAGVGCHFLLQGIFLTQGLNPHLLRLLPWQADSFTTEPPRQPRLKHGSKKCSRPRWLFLYFLCLPMSMHQGSSVYTKLNTKCSREKDEEDITCTKPHNPESRRVLWRPKLNCGKEERTEVNEWMNEGCYSLEPDFCACFRT